MTAASARSIPYGQPVAERPSESEVQEIRASRKCFTGCREDAVCNGFCDEHASEIEQDIDFEDCAPVQSRRAAMDARVRSDDARVRKSGGGE